MITCKVHVLQVMKRSVIFFGLALVAHFHVDWRCARTSMRLLSFSCFFCSLFHDLSSLFGKLVSCTAMPTYADLSVRLRAICFPVCISVACTREAETLCTISIVSAELFDGFLNVGHSRLHDFGMGIVRFSNGDANSGVAILQGRRFMFFAERTVRVGWSGDGIARGGGGRGRYNSCRGCTCRIALRKETDFACDITALEAKEG